MRRMIVVWVALLAVSVASCRLQRDVLSECDVCASRRSSTEYGLYFLRWGVALRRSEPEFEPSSTLTYALDAGRHAHRWETTWECWFGLFENRRVRSVRSSLRNLLAYSLEDSAKWRARTRDALDDGDFDLAQLERALGYFPMREDADSESLRQDYESVEERFNRRYGEHPTGPEPHYIR